METILPGRPEIFQENDAITNHLIELRTRALSQGDMEATIEELRWYMGLRDSAESINSEDQIVWKQLHRRYGELSDDQINELVHRLEETEFGDFINQ